MGNSIVLYKMQLFLMQMDLTSQMTKTNLNWHLWWMYTHHFIWPIIFSLKWEIHLQELLLHHRFLTLMI